MIVSDALILEQVYAALEPVEQQLGRRISPTLYTEEEFHRRRESGNPFLTKVLGGDYILLTGDSDDFLAAG